MKVENINNLIDRAYKCASDHGFHEEEKSNNHFLCLVISELIEAVEADRVNKHFDKEKHKMGEYAECQGWLTNEEKFINVFNRYIKDSVEDEIADAVIRLLDLYGLRGIKLNEGAFSEASIDYYSIGFIGKTFTESVFYIIEKIIFFHTPSISILGSPEVIILEFLGFAEHLNIDLIWHINQKMKYNELRDYKHNKKY